MLIKIETNRFLLQLSQFLPHIKTETFTNNMHN